MNDGSDEATCRGCGAMRSYRHQPGCPYEHPWPRDRVDNVQTQIEPIEGLTDEDMDALGEQVGRSDVRAEGEDPTMVTAADYETHIRPHIASLEAEIERLRTLMTEAAKQDPVTCRKRIQAALDIT